MKSYKVLREHTSGTTDYVEGDTRDLEPADAAELVRLGVLAGPDAEKSEGAADVNKSEGKAPANKKDA